MTVFTFIVPEIIGVQNCQVKVVHHSSKVWFQLGFEPRIFRLADRCCFTTRQQTSYTGFVLSKSASSTCIDASDDQEVEWELKRQGPTRWPDLGPRESASSTYIDASDDQEVEWQL